MKRSSLLRALDIIVVLALPCLLLLGIHAALAAETRPVDGAATADAQKLARGKYVVTIAGCDDCHTP